MHDIFQYTADNIEPGLRSFYGSAMTEENWSKIIDFVHCHFNAMRAQNIIDKYEFVINNELSDLMFEVSKATIKAGFLYIHYRNQELLTNFSIHTYQ